MDVLNQVITQATTDGFELRVAAVVFIILFNLVLSVVEAIKSKSFSFKKLPQFANDLVMSLAGLFVAELLVCFTIDSTWVNPVMIGLREIILLSILGCFIIKSLQSMKSIGWSVNINNSVQYLEGEEKNATKQYTSFQELDPLTPSNSTTDSTPVYPEPGPSISVDPVPNPSTYVDPGYNNLPNTVTPVPVPPEQ
jgi:hypothetical protein